MIKIMMIGVPGSGKSHMARHLAKEIDLTILSLAQARAKVYGDINAPGPWEPVWAQVEQWAQEAAKKVEMGQTQGIIYDSHNLTPQSRASAMTKLDALLQCNAGWSAVFCETYIGLCLERLQHDGREVKPRDLRRMAHRLVPPRLAEGFERLETVTPP